MQHLKTYDQLNEEIFGINKIIKKTVGTYKEPVYIYIIKKPEQSYIQNDWVVASSVNKKLMEILSDRFDIEVESEGNWSNWKVKTIDIDKIELFLKSLHLTKKEFNDDEGDKIIYRGRLSVKDISEYEIEINHEGLEGLIPSGRSSSRQENR